MAEEAAVCTGDGGGFSVGQGHMGRRARREEGTVLVVRDRDPGHLSPILSFSVV